MTKLAIDGGPAAITRPLTDGKKWGADELKEVIDVFESGGYYRYDGSKVVAFEEAFRTA